LTGKTIRHSALVFVRQVAVLNRNRVLRSCLLTASLVDVSSTQSIEIDGHSVGAQALPLIYFSQSIVGAKLKEDDMAKAKLITGLYKNRVAAEAAVDAIMKRGYTRDDISVLMSDATRSKEFALQARTHAADGAGVGGALGGVVGAVLAAIVAVGSTIVLPGLNLVIAGPIAAALAGAGAGAATGGVIGALIGAGIPEYRAKVYESGILGGGILLGVEAKADEEVDKLEELLEALGGEHVRTE
jgi:hypothetical protein